MSGGFIASVITVLLQNKSFSPGLDTIITAGQVAAWRSKWVALPVAIAVLWGGARLIRGIRKEPKRFAGLRAARLGLVAALIVTTLSATLVAVTVPERLRRRQWAIEAATYADIYTVQLAALEFRELRGGFPSTFKELRDNVPDPHGTIAAALSRLDPEGYSPKAVVAAASTKSKTQSLRGTALRNVNSAAQPLDQAVSFTAYELRVPGPDKLLYTDDDILVSELPFCPKTP